MKTTKKIVSLIITIIMTLAMSISAFAAGDTYPVTITGKRDGHIYEAYQIFKGDQTVTGSGASTTLSQTLTNIVWGDNVTVTDELYENLAKVKGASETFTDPKNAENAAKFLSGLNETQAKAAAKELNKALKGAPKSTANTSTMVGDNYKYTLNVPTGYYLIKDQKDSLNNLDYDAYTSYLLTVTKTAEINTKDGIPTVSKGVNSTQGETYREGISSQIGSIVYFKLEGTLPSNITDYDTYAYKFVDKMSSGLEYVDIVEVYYERQTGTGEHFDVNEDYYDVNMNNETNTLTVSFTDLHTALQNAGLTADVADGRVIVKYTAKLTENAVVGSSNDNEVYINYSNNPDGTGTGKTNTDKAYVYTYQFDGTKIDSSAAKNPLSGAQFAIYYDVVKNESGTNKTYRYWAILDSTTGKVTGWENPVDVTGDAAKKATPDNVTFVTSGSDGKFSIIGLKAGENYYLREIKAPADHSLLKGDLKIIITDGISTDGTTNSSLSLDFGNNIDSTEPGTVDVAAGTVSASIVNYKGSPLPSTGGIGTIIFYVIGSILIIGSGVALVAKKRAKNN